MPERSRWMKQEIPMAELDQAMMAIEEVHIEIGSDLPKSLFRAILEIEQRYVFDAEPEKGLRELEQTIDAFLRQEGLR